MKKPKLSVAYATYNEAHNMKMTLNSVYDWVDEIVIFDGSSTDDTVEVIKALDKADKILILSGQNPPVFHVNKQKAIDKCTGDWILQLDADEVVSKALQREILEVISAKSSTNGYWIPRLNYFLGKPLHKGGQYPDPTIRLYRAGKGRLACKSVHEQAEIDGEIGTLKNDLLHYPYPDFKEFLRKWSQYSNLEGDLMKGGVEPGLWTGFQYFVIKPVGWFLLTYFRHRGFQDGFAGFVFSLFSSVRFWIEYVSLIETLQKVK